MKKITTLLLLVLVVAMLCPMIASCTGDDTNAPTTTTQASGDKPGGDQVTDDPTKDEEGYEKDDLDQYNLNYNDDKIQVLHWNSEEPEFEIETTDGTKVNDAIYNRNLAIEDRLGVQLIFTEQAGNSSNISNFVKHVETTESDKTYDIIATYSRTASALSIKGKLADLNDIEGSYINFEKPWWPSSIIDTLTIGDALYYCSGDASTNIIHFMYTIYFNKDLAANYADIDFDGADNFYDLVRNKKWTIDKLIQFSSGRYEDLDSDEQGANFASSDLDDAYGFCTIYYGVDAFYTGSDLTIVERDDSGEHLLKLSDDYKSEKTISLVEKLQGWLCGPDCVTWASGSGQYRQPFVNGNALFCQERAYLAKRYLGEVGFKYGILPTPLYNTKQDDYKSVVGNPFTLYAIPTYCEDKLEMSAVIECWGSEGYRQTTPALFYETMQARYADAPEDAEMWELIKRTITFDIGRLLVKDDTGGYYLAEEPSKVACNPNKSWSNTFGQIGRLVQENIIKISDSYKGWQQGE